MKKRILSLLLALALLCAMLPQITWPAHAYPATSGTCGDNLTWRFDASTGTLTIEGSGEMYNYYSDTRPWYAHKDSIKQIVFPDGLTSIGDDAFYRCTGLTSVILPDGLTSIGDHAFYRCTGLTSVIFPAGLTSIGSRAFEGCTGLTSITFPDGLTSIGDCAFEGCTGLTSVTFPDGLTSIGSGAFYGCTGLTSVTLPAGLTSIGDDAFYRCTGLTAFSVVTENPSFSTDANGVLFDKEKAKLILYPCGRIGSYTVPNSVTVIGNDAFSGCTGLTSVTFPDGLSSIGKYAFWFCTGLTSITLPDGLTSIGECAFSYCTGLTSVTFPDGFTEIGSSAFSHCTGLTSVTFPAGLTSIGYGAFLSCTGLTLVTLPDGLTSIGEYAFGDCAGLTSVIIPESVTEIGNWAFGYGWAPEDDVAPNKIDNFTIYGYRGTAAQTYAQSCGFKFVPLDPASGFADVKPKHYYYNAMLWALERGITSGTSRVTFSPNDTCTRGQVMTFLYAAKGKPEADWSNNPFVDVKKSKYYYKPVLWAFQNGITNGVDATHFQPNGSCTRAQVVTFLWALSGKPDPAEGSNPFKDVKKSNWYYKAVLWAYQNGITSGVDATHFGPNQTCTRGQVVTFLYALLGK